MRPAFRARTFVIAVVFFVPALAASCGGDSKEKAPPPAAAGMAGSGTSMPPGPITCGADTCQPATLPFPPNAIAACCAEGDACGLDASPLKDYGFELTETCQARDQPGAADKSCPPSPMLMIPTDGGTIGLQGFTGCCRAETHTCGYLMDSLLAGVIQLGLGCVDSTPFLEGGTPSNCGDSGAAGAGN